MTIFFFIVLPIMAFLEGTRVSIPITLICLICFAVLNQNTRVFFPAFLAGLFIDLFRVQQIGISSAYFVSFIFLILLYKKKYEIYSLPFVLISTCIGSIVYLFIFGSDKIVYYSGISALIAGILFTLLRYLLERTTKRHKESFLPL